MAGDGSDSCPEEEAPISHPGRLLGQNRKFLDFFWDIAKPDQEIRLAATEGLIRYLQENGEDDDMMKYTLKRLIEGLAATREVSRPGFSLALAQVLQVFEEIPLFSVLEQIKEKHNLGRIKKKVFRNALFGNFFGVLALFQSGRLAKDSKALLECVQLLQGLSEHHVHLKDLPRKTLADIVSEIPESVFKEVLFSSLEDELTSAFSSPGQLYLLLVGIQRFPGVLGPEKLKDLLGTDAIITAENIPKLVEVLKMAVKMEKKDRTLPSVGLDLMKVALKEGAFELFWEEIVENGLLKDNTGPCSYMCYRLLGSSLPLLSLSQLKMVLRGEVMCQYGSHVVSTQLPERFKFAPEMEAYVSSFLEGCPDAEKQLAVMVGFSTLTNQGNPVVPTFWRVVRHLLPAALLSYISWLKDMFLNPDLDSCVHFVTKRQKQFEKKSHAEEREYNITRLRKWIIARLVGLIENPQIKREQEFVTDVARFCFFHAFFETKKPTSEIPETEAVPSVHLNEPARAAATSSFFSVLQHLSSMPALGDSAEAEAMRKKHVHGLTASGKSWIAVLVQYANLLLSRPKHVKTVTPFSNEAQDAWDRMLQTVEDLRKKERKNPTLKMSAFQQLLQLVGIFLFKSPAECIDLLNDLQNCTNRVFGELAQEEKKKKVAASGGEDEPKWVEVNVEVILSLLAQSSGLIRKVCKNVFGLISQHMTKRALQLILDVLDPQQDQDEESAIVVVEETDKKKTSKKDVRGDVAAMENSSSSCEDDSEDSDKSDPEEEDGEMDSEDEQDEETGENFRHQLMKVLQAGNAVGGDDSDEDLDDEAMMALDENLSALFAEQQKRIQAKKDEKEKMRKEKILRRDFKIKVLDLVDVFLTKQAENPLVFDVIDPLLSVIEQRMSSEASQQEQDYLRKTADIFMNRLCRSKQYCKNVLPIQEELHALLESLVKRACKQSESSVAIYCFSASLYIFRVLRGNPASDVAPQNAPVEKKPKNTKRKSTQELPPSTLGSLDLERVTTAYRDALNLLLTKRNSPLTGSMFLHLFERHPFMCKQLIDTVVKSVTEGARQHQQAQACMLLQKALQNRQFRLLMTQEEWEELIRESTNQVTEALKTVSEIKVKVDQEKVLKCLELLNFLLRTVTQQKLDVDLTELRGMLQALGQHGAFGKSMRLGNIYWNAMTRLGFTRPVKEKVSVQPKSATEAEPVKRKKKGFLPASKKRSLRKKVPGQCQENSAQSGSQEAVGEGAEAVPARKRKRKRNKRKSGEGGNQNQAPEKQGSPAKRAKLPPSGAKETDSKHGHLKKKQKKQKKGRKPARVDGN